MALLNELLKSTVAMKLGYTLNTQFQLGLIENYRPRIRSTIPTINLQKMFSEFRIQHTSTFK